MKSNRFVMFCGVVLLSASANIAMGMSQFVYSKGSTQVELDDIATDADGNAPTMNQYAGGAAVEATTGVEVTRLVLFPSYSQYSQDKPVKAIDAVLKPYAQGQQKVIYVKSVADAEKELRKLLESQKEKIVLLDIIGYSYSQSLLIGYGEGGLGDNHLTALTFGKHLSKVLFGDGDSKGLLAKKCQIRLCAWNKDALLVKLATSINDAAAPSQLKLWGCRDAVNEDAFREADWSNNLKSMLDRL